MGYIMQHGGFTKEKINRSTMRKRVMDLQNCSINQIMKMQNL